MKTINFFVFSLLAATTFAQTIQRVEPPNWWVGMRHQNIQLLVYGDNITDLQPTVSYEGVSIERVTKVNSPNYLFLDLAFAETVESGNVPIQFFRQETLITTHNYPLLDREAGRDQLAGFDGSDAIYLITPDRFVNGDPSNDNIAGMQESLNRGLKGGRHGGDISGIRQRLDYIHDLGFTAIWLNPLLENDMKEYSYHGYSTTDFYRVDPRFGTNEDYRVLANEARAKGMDLIMDMIVNHCGLYHWWMDDLPTEDWINQWPEYTQTNHKKTILQDPYAAAIDKKIFSDGWFVPTMPDLNQRNDLMARYLTQNSIWWVEYLGLAGIRMDTYPYPDMDYMADWTAAMMLEYPNLNIVGEEWYNEPTIVSYWQAGKENPNGYTSSLKSVMDFPLQDALVNALMEDDKTWGQGLVKAYEMLAHDFLYADPSNLVIFPDNHDMSRIYTQLNEDYARYQQAIAYFMTMRGIPQIYYGTEILMGNKGTTDHGIIRTDFPGGWSDDTVNAFSGQGLNEQQVAAQTFMRKLLHWRKTATAIHNGQLRHFVPEYGIYVYFRYNDTQKVMVILNKNVESVNLPLARFAEMLHGNSQGKDIIRDELYPLGDHLKLADQSVYILEIE